MSLIQIHEKPNAVPVNASVFVLETLVSGVWYTRKVTWEQLCGLISALDTLQNYYKKSETYTKQEVNALIAQIPSFTVEVVQELPTTDISTTTLYLVPKTTAGTLDYYDEYINLDGTTSGWEYVGKTEVDLSNYYTKAETEAYVQGDGADYIVGTKTFSTLTTTAKSILGAINEVAGVASSAQSDATRALSDASTAQGTANSASTAASNAQSTADSAVTAAGNAASAAAAAQQTANQAVTAAGNAQTTADGKSTVSISNVQGQSADNTRDKVADVTINGTTSSLYADNAMKVIKQMKTPKTVTGNPVTFETVEETYAKGAELTFGPIQDLHGYDSPWPAGAGKNKLKYTASTQTIDNVTFTVNDDGTITAVGTGTTSGSKTKYLNIDTTKIYGDLLLIDSGNNDNNNYDIFIWDSTTNYRVKQWDGTTASLSSYGDFVQVKIPQGDTCLIALRVADNVSNVNYTFKPMLCVAGTTDKTYAPYSNICPISGRDSVILTVGGKNKINQDTITKLIRQGTEYSSGITNADGVITITYSYQQQGSYGLSQIIPIYNGNITITADYKIIASSGTPQVRTNVGNTTNSSSATDTTNKFITLSSANTWERKSVTYTLNANASEGITLNLQPTNSGHQLQIKNLQVEIGTTATDYEPYIAPRTTTQSFSSTEYGATGSIKDGDWDRTKKLVDLGDLTWSMTSTSGCFRTHDLDALAKLGTTGQESAISSVYKNIPTARDVESLPEAGFCIGGGQSSYKLFLKDTRYTTPEAFKAAIAGQTICYELETPEAITGGTAQDILLNAGTNVASTDADTATVTYTEMTTLDDTPEGGGGGGGGGGIDYSTSEVDTGLKWINNKPIYQRTFSVTIPQYDNTINGYMIASGVTYIDDLVEINGSIKKTASGSSSDTYAGLDGVQGSDGWKVSPHIDDGVLMLWSGSGSYGGDIVGATATITIKYTKTA